MKNLVVNRQSAVKLCRVRQLPIPGQVLVEEGQSVHPEDLIAESLLSSELYYLDIARGLGVDPADVLACLVRDMGDVLEADDVIAERDGTFPRLVRVPRGGRLLACRDGVAVLASGKLAVGVRAAMIGTAADVRPEWGATITAQGSLVQGLWGNGRVGAGILRVQTSPLDQAITMEELTSFGEGQVIAMGFCTEEQLLERVLDQKPTGLILGALDAQRIARVMALDIPVILLNGFGDLRFDPPSLAILRQKVGEVVCLNASQPDPIGGFLPEVMIPGGKATPSAALPYRAELKAGQQVLALSGAARGEVMRVAELPDGETTLESGLTCKTTVLRPAEGDLITLPRQNVLIVGASDG